MRKIIFLLVGLLFCNMITVNAQQNVGNEQKLLSPGTPFFVPHWYIKVQGGLGYDVGEAKFSDLLSPSFQLTMGYKFDQLIGIRGGLSGFWARNRYAYPEADYKWNFVQPAVDVELDLTTLIGGRDPERNTNVYAFAGLGVAYSFGNDDAVKANEIPGIDFQKLWPNNRWNPVVRAGLGVDFYVSDNIAINGEINGNMLPDHFNSKLGRNDNKDWHFNALVGVKFALGKRRGYTEPVYQVEQVQRIAKPDTAFVDVPIENISFNVNIYFIINRSDIRTNQMQKLSRLIAYLDKHPKAFVRLSGYADRDTGTPEINMRLSRERSAVVSKFLQEAGIQGWRIRSFAKGDRVQPFDKPQDNRVCICYVYDPDHPERIDNWY